MRQALPVIAVLLAALAAGLLLGALYLAPLLNGGELLSAERQSFGSTRPAHRVDADSVESVDNDYPGGTNPASDLANLKSRLHSASFSEREVALMMLALIRDQVIGEPVDSESTAKYWQQGFATSSDAGLVQVSGDSADEIRNALIELFGDSARDRAEFRRWFFPLGPSHSYLSSSKQIQLRRIQEGYRHKLADLRGGGYTDSESRQRRAELEADRDATIRSLLSPGEHDQYQLRVAPLATGLRGTLAGVQNLSQQEFDAIYGIYESLDTKVSNPAVPQDVDQMVANDMVRDLLGADRYETFERGRDPIFALLNRIASRHGATEQAIDRAYETTRRLRETAREELWNVEYSQAERNARYRELIDDAARDIERLIGKEAARQFMNESGRMVWINSTQG